MNIRNFKSIIWLVLFILIVSVVAPAQKSKCKKWTYDYSEKVKYFETPLEACQGYVKEKYPDFNYKAVVEVTNDAETFRCSADDTYIGVVYKRECDSCCSKKPQNFYSHNYFDPPFSVIKTLFPIFQTKILICFSAKFGQANTV